MAPLLRSVLPQLLTMCLSAAALANAFSPAALSFSLVSLVPLVAVFFSLFAPSPVVVVSVVLLVVLSVFLLLVSGWVPFVYTGQVLVPALVLVSLVVSGCRVSALLVITPVVYFTLPTLFLLI